MIRVSLKGNTYGIKQTLKDLGFKWNGKEWIRNFKDSEKDQARELTNRWHNEGVYGTITKN